MIIVIDADGTAIDSMGMLQELAVEVMCKHSPLTKLQATNHFLDTVGRPFTEQVARCRAIPSAVDRTVVEEFNERKRDRWLSSPSFPGFRAVLNVARAEGIAAVLASSTEPKLIAHWLQRQHDLGDVLMSPQLKADFLYEMAQHHGDVLLIGDTPYDAELADGCEISFIGVRHTFRNWEDPNLTLVNNLTEVPACVRRCLVKHTT